MPAEPLPPPDQRKHRVIVTLTCEVQEILRTGENSGTPRHAAKELITFDGETLDHAKQRLDDFLTLGKRLFTQ